MGTGKKEQSRLVRQGKTGTGSDNVKVKGENFYRSAKKMKKLNMRKDHGAQRNSEGKIVQAAKYQSRDVAPARIEPNRRWFTNTRVISQDSLSQFRDAMAEQSKDPFQVLLKSNKLPMTLIRDGAETNGIKKHQAKMTIESSPYASVFGDKSTRKRVKLSSSSFADLADDAEQGLDAYKDRLEQAKLLSGNSGEGLGDGEVDAGDPATMAIEPVFSKGQSKRIFNEMYKVLDSSDVVLHVLDARDPEGTRCRSVEKYLKAEAPHKHLIFVLNKVDLIPTSVAAAWVRHLSKEVPTLAFKSSINNAFGRGSLIELLRQYAILHKDRKQISVGLIGYPNVGKSSLINCLRRKKVATTAPIPGETKVWQYVTLMKRIFLIDCPGVVPPSIGDTPSDILLRGVVRLERVDNPEQYIPDMMKKVKVHHLEKTYNLERGSYTNHVDFLEYLARKSGRLHKAGEPDLDGTAKIVLTDFMRGNIPWFTPAPVTEGDESEVRDGRVGRLGEMSKKRKREEGSASTTAEQQPAKSSGVPSDGHDEDEGEFEGFDSVDDEDPSLDNSAVVDELEDGDSDDMIPLDELSDVDSDDSSEGEEEEKG
ncbi:nucleolar GTP-binding protein 2 [Xylariaceae sp. FL0016]|nr:nucleolar GTP-binding protein 2 [Xylariaceae sp. FL0016]